MTAQVDSARDFGGRLRTKREAREVTLRDIASATNLSVAQLEALERNDLARLPGGIFLRGIVRSYAQQIGEDPETTVRDFAVSFPDNAAATVAHLSQIDYEKATTPRRGARGAIVIAIVLVLLAVLLIALRSKLRW